MIYTFVSENDLRHQMWINCLEQSSKENAETILGISNLQTVHFKSVRFW